VFTGRIVRGDQFSRLLQLIAVCPEPGGDSGQVRAVSLYFGLLGLVSRPVRMDRARGSWMDRIRAQWLRLLSGGNAGPAHRVQPSPDGKTDERSTLARFGLSRLDPSAGLIVPRTRLLIP